MITVSKGIEKEKILTLEDMAYGDSFVILVSNWDGVYLMCDNDLFVNISTGSTYDVAGNECLPVRKFDFTLIEKQEFRGGGEIPLPLSIID